MRTSILHNLDEYNFMSRQQDPRRESTVFLSDFILPLKRTKHVVFDSARQKSRNLTVHAADPFRAMRVSTFLSAEEALATFGPEARVSPVLIRGFLSMSEGASVATEP